MVDLLDLSLDGAEATPLSTFFDFVNHSSGHVTDLDAHLLYPFTDSDARVIGPYIADGSSGPERDLKDIVDIMLNPPSSASLGRFPTSRLMRQVKRKLANVDNPDDDFVNLDVCYAVQPG